MKRLLTLTPAQADALARLIQMQCDACEEACFGSNIGDDDSPFADADSRRKKRRMRKRAPIGFTVEDLECIEPLIRKLRARSAR